MLISGPPGLGKTTLAQIVAKHCGYNLIEINASDDRTAGSIENLIAQSLQTQNSFLSGEKPNCILIDEIDGVSGASSGSGEQTFINLLVQIAEGKSKTQPGQKQKKKKSKFGDLMRPIICICNDLYAPSLRPLRAIAQIVVFRPPPFQTLAKRMFEICKWEGLDANLQVMMSLCELSQGDMRSSINTLQFLKSKANRIVASQLQDLVVGSKDMSLSWFKVGNSIFQKMPPVSKEKLGDKQFKKSDQSGNLFSN